MNNSPSECFAIQSFGAVLFISTNSERLHSFFRNDPFIKHHIPGVSYIPLDQLPFTSEDGCWKISFWETPDPAKASFDAQNLELKVYGSLERDYSEIMFVFNALQMFARMHQDKSMFGLHCGGISANGKAILIVGGTDAGKSTVTSILCTNYDLDFLNDERAILRKDSGNVIWMGGNSVLRPRDVNNLNSQKLSHKFEDVSHLSVVTHKHCYQVINAISSPMPVSDIFFVKLTSEGQSLRKAHQESSIYTLNAALAEDIHGIWAPILSAHFAMPSLDHPQICQERLKLAYSLAIPPIRLWNVRGEANEVCEQIRSVM